MTTRRSLSLIFAVAENGVIGKDGRLPWDLPEDRAHFLRTTEGHPVIMGRRTWQERGTPLPNRTNIVVSRSFVPPPGMPEVLAARDLDSALELAWAEHPEPFVIGGVRLFEEAMPHATRVYVTEVAGAPAGDTFFHFDRSRFRVVDRRVRGPLTFLILEPEHRD
jgi:dihydrofolate reductase